MFTGIITAIGHIVATDALGQGNQHGKRLHIRVAPDYLSDVGLGDSIALNGACMTVTQLDADLGRFSVEVSAESLARTCGLAGLGAINLEKALRAQDRLGGHLVSGHVDGRGRVLSLTAVGESHELVIAAPRDLAGFIAYKGSITVNGVSLTVNRVADHPSHCALSINLIAHTLGSTTLGQLRADDAVNLEIDLLARYVHRLTQVAGASGAA